jgi:hypothetical protein
MAGLALAEDERDARPRPPQALFEQADAHDLRVHELRAVAGDDRVDALRMIDMEDRSEKTLLAIEVIPERARRRATASPPGPT